MKTSYITIFQSYTHNSITISDLLVHNPITPSALNISADPLLLFLVSLWTPMLTIIGYLITYLGLLLLVEEHRPLISTLDPTLSWVILSSCHSPYSYLLPILDAVYSLAFHYSFSLQDSNLELPS